LGHIGQVSYESKDHKAGEDTRSCVGERDHEGVPQGVLVELVVACQGDQASVGRAHCEEDLNGGIEPDVDVGQA